ncbi:hypothetical protein QN277_022355 [Acacia crassicarpa]|uniref:Uncharacterized protein n=1 Tax=Acacia crassicarpa TaxID=499986 RepID=A0AAE1JGN4_9FABA|nr:hypothetical protein QN277_022355 [Acacia crassicarpa]
MVGSKQGLPSWIGVAAARVDFEGKVSSMSSSSSNPTDNHSGSSAAPPRSHSDVELSIERELSLPLVLLSFLLSSLILWTWPRQDYKVRLLGFLI